MADETWFSGLSPEEQAHVTAKGWDKLATPAEAAAAAARSHFGAEKLIGHPADQVLKLPKDASDPSYQSVYDRVVGMSMPKDPTEYKFDAVKFKDGAELDADDVTFIRELATKLKLPTNVAQGIANAFVERAENFAAAEAVLAETTKAANTAYLRQSYGADYDVKVFAATKALEVAGLPASMLQYAASLPAHEYKTVVDAFVALGQKMGEAAMLRGGGGARPDPTVGLTPEAAQQRLDTLKADPTWSSKFLADDAAAKDEFNKLIALIVAGRMPRQ